MVAPSNPLQPRPLGRIHNLTLKQVRAFVATAEHKSISRAAQQLFLTQSAFSRCIQDLESSVGEVVFKRTAHGVTLSSAGEVFLPFARRLLQDYADAASALENWRSTQRGKLVLAGSNAVIPLVLPSLLARLRAEFGVAAMEVEDCSSAEVIDRVRSGRAAFGIGSTVGGQTDLIFQPLLKVQLGLLAAQECVIPENVHSLDDLNGIPMVRFGEDALITQTLRARAIKFDAYFTSKVVASNSVPATFPLLRTSGMAMVASGIGATNAQAQDLRFVPLPGLLPSVEVALVSRRDLAFDPQLEILKELVRDSVLAMPWHSSVERLCRPASGSWREAEKIVHLAQ